MVTKFKIPVLLMGLLWILSACNTTAASPTITQPAELPPTQQLPTDTPPTPIPDARAPAAINAPLIEAPALIDINFLNELDGWGVTDTQIVRTNDGGITWYNVTPPNVAQAGLSPSIFVLDNEHIWLQIPDMTNYPNAGTLYRTSDAGLTWTSAATPFSSANMTFMDESNGWVLADLGAGAGSNAVAVYQTTDGGANWNQTYINDPNSPNAHDSLPLGGLKNGLTPLNMQTAWVTGVTYSSGSVYLYRTDDSGANWALVTSLPLPPGAESAELGSEQVDFVTPQDAFMTVHVAAADFKTAVYVSNDAGNTWSLTPTLIPNSGSTDFLSAREAVIYNGEQFYVTQDAAQTWSTVPTDPAFRDTFAMMDFVNTSTGWVITLDSNDHRSLYRTSDGGTTWSLVIP